ncbi:MAG TPA: EscD/YscD/HrpQ family type III secretion system inner membrane ring protein [Leucothrix mucor]|nr:EscD/YscD/HrpQ family type III secretion system inner membrane ring protein [Leucothrix mucor]
MVSNGKQFSLKVLSGANIGAQITLEDKKSVVVGKSAKCNVIFNNEDVADRHIKLVLTDGRVRLRPLAQPVYVEGKDIGLHDVTLLPYQLVTIGKVGFSVGDGSGQWPRVDSQGRKISFQLEDQSIKEPSSGAWKKWLFWLGLALLIAANLQYFTRDTGGLFSVVGLKDTVEQEVYSAIGDAGLSNISVLKARGGRFKVTGYVATNEQKQHLIGAIQRVDRRVDYSIWVNANIENNALLIAQTLDEDQVHFSSKEDGTLYASGYVQSQSDWHRLRDSVLEDVEGIALVNDTQIKSMLELLRSKAKTQDLSKVIQVYQKGKQFMVTGNPSQRQLSRWHDVVDEVMRPVKGYWDVIEDFKVSAETKEFKLSLMSVSIGDVPFVVSKDGTRYLEGAHLGEGYYLKKIMADHVLLKHNGTEIPVYFGKKGDSK